MKNYTARLMKSTSCYGAAAALIASSFPAFAFTPLAERTYLPDDAPLPWLQQAAPSEPVDIARVLPADSLPWLATENSRPTVTAQPDFSNAIAGARKISPIQARQLKRQHASYAYSMAEPAVYRQAEPCIQPDLKGLSAQTELVAAPTPQETGIDSTPLAEMSAEITLPKDVEEAGNPFAEVAQNNAVSNEDLSEMRGAFVSSNGMVIDFGLVTQTVINGNPVSQLEITSGQLNQINPSDLQKLIQVTEQSVDVRQLGIDDLPGVLTVIQNSANDQLIQNFNILNLEVENLGNFRSQALVPQINDALINR